MPTHPFRGTAPFFLLSAIYIAGRIVGLAAWDGWWAVSVLTGLLALVSAASRLPVLATGLAVTLFCGVLSAGRTGYVDPEVARPFLDNEMVFRGTVESVKVTDAGWSGTADNVTVSTLDNRASLRLARSAFYIRNPDTQTPFPAELRATGRLHPIRSMGNPDGIPREWEALASGTQFAFTADSSKTILFPCPDSSARFAAARERTGRWIVRVTGKSEGGLYLLSLATGMVPSASHPLVVLFRATGLAHLFAISGINVVIFFAMHAALLRGFLWVLRMRKGSPDLNRIASFGSLPVCWAYVLMAGAPIPAVRSAGMVTAAVLLWNLVGVRGAGFGLSLLFSMVVAVTPFSILTPSFLLSYGAVFFLICATRTEENHAEEIIQERKAGLKIGRWFVVAIESSAVVFCGTLPVSAAFFQGLPIGSILWNVLFCPLLGSGGVAGSFLAVLGGMFQIEFLEVPVRFIADLLGWEIMWLRTISGNGSGYFALPPSGVGPMAFSSGLAVAASLWLRSNDRRVWPAPVTAALLFLFWIHLPYVGMPDARMSVTALNVGNGASHVIGFPGGGTMVLDCGSALRGDSGKRILVPYLRSIGVNRIDLLVLSHPHEDHFGGVAALLEAMPVEEIWIPEGIPVRLFGNAVSTYTGYLRSVGKGFSTERGGAVVKVRSVGDGSGTGANSSSLLIEAGYGRFSAWFPGDVEGGPSSWGAIDEKKDDCRVLFLPHHGSKGADPEGWVVAASPDIAVIQNRNCLAGKNLVPSNKIFALDNGALTIRTDGCSVIVRQEDDCRLWRFLCRFS